MTPKLPRLLLLFTHAQRPPPSGFVLTAYPVSYLFSNGFVGHFLVHEPAKSYAKWHILQLHWVA
jgi:hypothetical protein